MWSIFPKGLVDIFVSFFKSSIFQNSSSFFLRLCENCYFCAKKVERKYAFRMKSLLNIHGERGGKPVCLSAHETSRSVNWHSYCVF